MTARGRAIRTVGYVARCAVAATLALVLARWLGLDHPVWATVSALIVSQDQRADTRRSLGGRAVGTLIGVAIGLAVGFATADLSDPQIAGVAMATIMCAVVARERPAWRTCLWTGPIVLLTASATEPLVATAFQRAAEVLLGGAIGTIVHELMTIIVYTVTTRRPRGKCPGPDERIRSRNGRQIKQK